MDYKKEYEKLLEKCKNLEKDLKQAKFDRDSVTDDQKGIKEKSLKELIDLGLAKDAKFKKLQAAFEKQINEYKLYSHK